MEEGRAGQVSNIYKNIKSLGNSLKIPSTIAPIVSPQVANAIGVPVQGSGFVRILMYVIAGLLLIGIILLGVDQWVTPVFQRTPGAPGYIAIPGADKSQVFWTSPNEVKDIVVGVVAPPVSPPGFPQPAIPPSMTTIEGQAVYSLTMDILISDEYPQDLGTGQTQRVFFVMSQTVDNPSLQLSLDNSKNTVYITCFDSNGYQQSIAIDNVPIHSTFRIGLTMSNYTMEGYLNGLLVKTRQLDSAPRPPATGDKIFAPGNIKRGNTILSRGISVLNMRGFGYIVSSAEMKGRMSDMNVRSLFDFSAPKLPKCS